MSLWRDVAKKCPLNVPFRNYFDGTGAVWRLVCMVEGKRPSHKTRNAEMKSTIFIVGIVVAAVSLTAVGAYAGSQSKGHGFFGHGMHGGGYGMHGRGHGDKHGGGHGMHGEQMSFEKLDTDGDGQITFEEMQNRGKGRFSDMDTNQDGKLSPAEMEAHAQKRTTDRVAEMIEHFDKDGDGMLSVDEMPGSDRGERMFDRVDKDGSGGISEEEFDEVRSRMMRHGKRHMDEN